MPCLQIFNDIYGVYESHHCHMPCTQVFISFLETCFPFFWATLSILSPLQYIFIVLRHFIVKLSFLLRSMNKLSQCHDNQIVIPSKSKLSQCHDNEKTFLFTTRPRSTPTSCTQHQQTD